MSMETPPSYPVTGTLIGVQPIEGTDYLWFEIHTGQNRYRSAITPRCPAMKAWKDNLIRIGDVVTLDKVGGGNDFTIVRQGDE